MKPIVMSISDLQILVTTDSTKLRKEYEGKEILLVNMTKKKIICTLIINRIPKQYKFEELFKLR